MKHCFLFANGKAGKQRIKTQLAEVIDLLNQHDYDCTVVFSQYPHHVEELVFALDEKVDLVLISGGDGTLNEAINGLMKSGKQVPLGYLPSGTTNDFASSMGIPKDCVKALKMILSGQPILIDVGRMENHYFGYVASFGAFTESVYRTEQSVKNAIGYAAYLLEGVKSIVDIRPVQMKITLDEGVMEGNYIFGAITNSTSIAGFVKLDKHLVQMNDGLFELLLIECPKDLSQIARIANYINNHNYNNEFMKLIQTKRVKIECNRKIDWNFDGEQVEGKQEMVFEIVPDAIYLWSK